jgi:hypothetical protein
MLPLVFDLGRTGMRCKSAVSDRALVRAFAAIAAALLVLWFSATPAFGQNDRGDDVQFRAVCQNIIGAIGVTQTQYANATGIAVGGGDTDDGGRGSARAVAAIAQEQGVSIAQVNECLNAAERSGVRTATAAEDQYKDGVIAATIPEKALPFTGGIPLLGLFADIGIAAIVAGVIVLRAVMSRRP